MRQGLHLHLQAYQALVEKHSQLSRSHRILLEQMGDAAVEGHVEELLSLRKHLAELLPKYDAACDHVAELRCEQDPGPCKCG
jgi:hypothetical protein